MILAKGKAPRQVLQCFWAIHAPTVAASEAPDMLPDSLSTLTFKCYYQAKSRAKVRKEPWRNSYAGEAF